MSWYPSERNLPASAIPSAPVPLEALLRVSKPNKLVLCIPHSFMPAKASSGVKDNGSSEEWQVSELHVVFVQFLPGVSDREAKIALQISGER